MKEIRFRLLKRLKSLQPYHSFIDNKSTNNHIQSSETCFFQNPQNHPIFKEHECITRVEKFELTLQATKKGHTESNNILGNESFKIPVSHPAAIKEVNVNCQDLSSFVPKCAPGGSNSVILYTTSLRGIRKTFEDCQSIKFLLDSFQVVYHERDVSMHLEFREELWEILGGRIIPPRLFIKGRHVGGVDEVVSLHECGELKNLLQGIPVVASNLKCGRCSNVRFVLCCNCHGSRKVFNGEGREGSFARCSICNENGLIKCPLCF